MAERCLFSRLDFTVEHQYQLSSGVLFTVNMKQATYNRIGTSRGTLRCWPFNAWEGVLCARFFHDLSLGEEKNCQELHCLRFHHFFFGYSHTTPWDLQISQLSPFFCLEF
jgi:hypothetical protein